MKLPQIKKLTQAGVAHIEVFIIAAVLIVVGGVGYYVYQARNSSEDSQASAALTTPKGLINSERGTPNATATTIAPGEVYAGFGPNTQANYIPNDVIKVWESQPAHNSKGGGDYKATFVSEPVVIRSGYRYAFITRIRPLTADAKVRLTVINDRGNPAQEYRGTWNGRPNPNWISFNPAPSNVYSTTVQNITASYPGERVRLQVQVLRGQVRVLEPVAVIPIQLPSRSAQGTSDDSSAITLTEVQGEQ